MAKKEGGFQGEFQVAEDIPQQVIQEPNPTLEKAAKRLGRRQNTERGNIEKKEEEARKELMERAKKIARLQAASEKVAPTPPLEPQPPAAAQEAPPEVTTAPTTPTPPAEAAAPTTPTPPAEPVAAAAPPAAEAPTTTPPAAGPQEPEAAPVEQAVAAPTTPLAEAVAGAEPPAAEATPVSPPAAEPQTPLTREELAQQATEMYNDIEAAMISAGHTGTSWDMVKGMVDTVLTVKDKITMSEGDQTRMGKFKDELEKLIVANPKAAPVIVATFAQAGQAVGGKMTAGADSINKAIDEVQQRPNVQLSSTIGTLEHMAENPQMGMLMGSQNAKEFKARVGELRERFNAAEPEDKATVAQDGLAKMERWCEQKSKETKSSGWQKLKAVVSCAASAVKNLCSGNKQAYEADKSKLDQAVKAFSGHAQAFGKALDSIKATVQDAQGKGKVTDGDRRGERGAPPPSSRQQPGSGIKR